jgi:hypothetical protein
VIRTPTLFILGAGASCPYGLPSGTKLLLQSLESLKLKANERNVATMLGRTPAAKQRLEAFRSALHESRSYSVDVSSNTVRSTSTTESSALRGTFWRPRKCAMRVSIGVR